MKAIPEAQLLPSVLQWSWLHRVPGDRWASSPARQGPTGLPVVRRTGGKLISPGKLPPKWFTNWVSNLILGFSAISFKIINIGWGQSVGDNLSVLSLSFALKTNYGGGDEDNGDLLQKVPGTCCHSQCPQALQHGIIHPRLHRRLLDTHRQGWVSLFWGHCSFLLGPGTHKVLFVPSKSPLTQSCLSTGGSVVGLMASSSKRAYAIPRSATPRAPAPATGHCWPVPLQETLRHSSGWGPWVLVRRRFVWALWACLAGKGFDSECDFAHPTVLLGLLLCPWMWGLFFWWDPTFSSQRLFSSEL